MEGNLVVWQGNYHDLYIDGQWRAPASSDVIAVVSPFTEQVIAEVPDGSREDMDHAVASARRAFDAGPWPRLRLEERMGAVRRLSEYMLENEELIASLVTSEMGCPISLSRVMQSRSPRMLVDSFLDLAEDYPWSSVRTSSAAQALVTREPVGVVAIVIPWNAPLLSLLIKLAPALLSGCTVVVKPAPEAPLNTYLLGELLDKAEIPAGVVNIVPAGREAGEHLVTHPDVDKVAFTGSTAAGRRIASLCGRDLRRVTLELGGKSAAVVLEDADLDLVIDNVRALSLRNSGQTCSNKTRIVVPRRLEREIGDRLVGMMEGLKVGDPMDPATDIGPLVAQRQQELVKSYITTGREEGAHLLVGGGTPADLPRGWFVEPTVFTGVTPSMRIAQEEIFGPVLTVIAYDSEDEAVVIANDSMYGLSGSVFSRDDARALAVARGIRTGVVEINGGPVGWQAPIGGFKASGIGRESGPEGFDAYNELKSYGLTNTLASSVGA
ncbi:aldehyde dehydrogenase [Rhodococcus sp. WAY2]|uniref:aldehyde dehydrogenase n=1 Tax=Rhodococcus sp. WAY2 TaxID=2663121 RepID=UPI00135A26DB|nr:aldehyde dehydrogenase [Rhodococcus sp. WAY2]